MRYEEDEKDCFDFVCIEKGGKERGSDEFRLS